MTARRALPAWLLASTILFAAGCNERGLAYGDPNSIIAVMDQDQWFEVEDDIYAAFEQTITTVRAEKKFTVTYQEPYAEHWLNLRRFRQMLIVGTMSDAIVQEVLDEAPEPITEGGVHELYDIWSNGQQVNLVILREGWGPDDLRPHLATLSEKLDSQYRRYAQNRMYMSGLDTALTDTLSTEHGFSLQLPSVYQWRHQDGVFVFRNDNPDPSELIREIVVTWESPAPASVTAGDLLEWRARVVAEHYSVRQDTYLEGQIDRMFDFNGHPTVEVQAQWRNPPDLGWPAGGPFITRAITCEQQDRTYLVDAWLYAPGKEKYEYMIQLETILGTFDCG